MSKNPAIRFHCMKWLVLIAFFLLQQISVYAQPEKTGILNVHFVQMANNKEMVLRDSVYKNAFGEEYSIKKLKYYISHFSVPGSKSRINGDPYHLVNAANDVQQPLALTLNKGSYTRLEFLLGVDSAANCSGAQAGALDPMNDMFWTWSSGYVVFKLEGESPSSNADLGRIEHHIGGYKGENNVSVTVSLSTEGTFPIIIKPGETTDLFIALNLDKYWKGVVENKISESPLVTTAGALARKISNNFPGMFYIIVTGEKL